jgi:hypothetical protein
VKSVVGGVVNAVKKVASSTVGKVVLMVVAGAFLGPMVGALGASIGGTTGAFVTGVGTAMAAPAAAIGQAFTAATGSTILADGAAALNGMGGSAASAMGLGEAATTAGAIATEAAPLAEAATGATVDTTAGAAAGAAADTAGSAATAAAPTTFSDSIAMAKSAPWSAGMPASSADTLTSLIPKAPDLTAMSAPSGFGSATNIGAASLTDPVTGALTTFDATGVPITTPASVGDGSLINGVMDGVKKAGSGVWNYATSKEAAPMTIGLVGNVMAGYGKGQQMQTQHDWDMDAIARRNANLAAPIILAPYKPTTKLGG